MRSQEWRVVDRVACSGGIQRDYPGLPGISALFIGLVLVGCVQPDEGTGDAGERPSDSAADVQNVADASPDTAANENPDITGPSSDAALDVHDGAGVVDDAVVVEHDAAQSHDAGPSNRDVAERMRDASEDVDAGSPEIPDAATELEAAVAFDDGPADGPPDVARRLDSQAVDALPIDDGSADGSRGDAGRPDLQPADALTMDDSSTPDGGIDAAVDGHGACTGDEVGPPCNGCPAGILVPIGWVCVPAGEFWMGSGERAPAGRHPAVIGHR